MPRTPQVCVASATRFFPRAVLLSLSAAGLTAVFVLIRRFLRRRRRSASQRVHSPSSVAVRAALVRQWCMEDPDPATRSLATSWVSDFSISTEFIFSRLSLSSAPQLTFGTAGLRARTGPGHDRLNARVVAAAAQALCVWLLGRDESRSLSSRTVIIAHDARHGGRVLAIAAAQAISAKGVNVLLVDKPVATPVISWAVRAKALCAGVVITASHNPKEYNGFKVFEGPSGAQISDHNAREVEALVKVHYALWQRYSLRECDIQDMLVNADILIQEYARHVASVLRTRSVEKNAQAKQQVAYTALHGVGYAAVQEVFREFALAPVIPTKSQCKPDGNFPTVKKPNPEEKDALCEVTRTARRFGARLALANDPDADRLAAAEIGADFVRTLSGDEMALLLADYLLLQCKENERPKCILVRSAVSSRAIEQLAAKRGCSSVECLTGFKWLSRAALDAKDKGFIPTLAYEEAVGFMIGDAVADKDGVTAAAVFVEMFSHWEEQGKTLQMRLAELYDECGWHLGGAGYLEMTEESNSPQVIFENALKKGLPDSFGEVSVVSVRNLAKGTDSAQSNGKATLPQDNGKQFLTIRCCTNDQGNVQQPDVVVHLRASGTEPKLKYYAEIRCDREAAESGRAKQVLNDVVENIIDEILQPKQNKLLR